MNMYTGVGGLLLEDLTASLLIEWNRKVLDQNYKKSFDFYVKMYYPRSYKRIIEEVKYWRVNQ